MMAHAERNVYVFYQNKTARSVDGKHRWLRKEHTDFYVGFNKFVLTRKYLGILTMRAVINYINYVISRTILLIN